MSKGIYVATSGSMAQLRHLETLSNNLANTRTAGYKGDQLTFETVRARHERSTDPNVADPAGLGKHFVDVHERVADLAPGPVSRTDNPLDVALTGNGFLTVETSRGRRLTRDGRMLIGRDGTLRTTSGHSVLDQNGRSIRLPPDRVPTIDERGRIRAGNLDIGQLGVVAVDMLAGMAKDADGFFVPPTEAARPSVDMTVLQGHVEESNVRPVQMMLELVEVQRTFSALRQVISASGEMDSQAARLAQ